jgi:hypothetical protein
MTGVVQSSSWYGAQGAVHTYSQSVQITSPSGRVATCGFSNPVPATQAVNYQCTAQLSTNNASGGFEAANYTISGFQKALCSEVGEFAYAVLPSPIAIVFSTTAYKNGGATSGGWYYYSNCCGIDPGCPTCKGPDPGMTRSTNSPYWIYVRVGVRFFGAATVCTSRVLNDQPMSRLAKCGDTFTAP